MKRQYKSINDAKIKLQWCKAIAHKPLDFKWKRIRHSSSYYCETLVDNDKIVLLKSYETIVALYNKTKDIVIICNKYSRTTSRHVTEFIGYYATLETPLHFIEY